MSRFNRGPDGGPPDETMRTYYRYAIRFERLREQIRRSAPFILIAVIFIVVLATIFGLTLYQNLTHPDRDRDGTSRTWCNTVSKDGGMTRAQPRINSDGSKSC